MPQSDPEIRLVAAAARADLAVARSILAGVSPPEARPCPDLVRCMAERDLYASRNERGYEEMLRVEPDYPWVVRVLAGQRDIPVRGAAR